MDVMDAEHDPDYGSPLRCNTGSCLIEIKEEKDPLFEYSEELVPENEYDAAMVEAEHGVDYESHQTCDRENGLIKVKEEKDPVLLALLEWDTDEEEEEEQEEEEEEQQVESGTVSCLVSCSKNEPVVVKEEVDPLLVTVPVADTENKEPTISQEVDDPFRVQIKSQEIYTALEEDTNRGRYTCDICNKSLTDLQRHQEILSDNQLRLCDACEKSSTHQKVMKSSDTSVHDEEGVYSCGLCNKSFPKPTLLQSHQCKRVSDHPYCCVVYNSKFDEQGNLKVHKLKQKYPYACDICTRTFNRISNLKTHKQTHGGERLYSCDTCNKLFSRRSNLKVHKRIHSGERPYVCAVCNKSFRLLHILKTHKLIHSVERPYSCEVCNKSFKLPHSLKIHQRVHSGVHPYSCNMCRKSFSHLNHLRQHERIHIWLK